MTDPGLDGPAELRLDEMLARLSGLTESDLDNLGFAAFSAGLGEYAELRRVTGGLLPSVAFMLGYTAGTRSPGKPTETATETAT